jgi:3-deoxy-D-manno-octulosonate 8-phosphate phosphatase (KDO 8-P phosphatase)
MTDAVLDGTRIKLMVYDFDGVMTDNRALLFPDGREAVFVNRSDGLAVGRITALGIPQVIISTEANEIVRTRAAKLQLPVHHNVGDKLACLRQVIAAHQASPNTTVYIGNDTNDLEAMQYVAWPIAPRDAHQDVLAAARIVTNARGGEGVIREILDLLTGEAGPGSRPSTSAL